MKTKKNDLVRNLLLGFAVVAATSFLGCNTIYGGNTGSQSGDGLVLTITDTLTFNIDLGDDPYTGSDNFDLDDIREKLDDKGIALSSAQITDLQVIYDDASMTAFLAANADVDFSLEVSYLDAGDWLLALQTTTLNTSTVGANQVLFELNQNLFGIAAGFSSLMGSIQDTTVHTANVEGKIVVVPASTTLEPGQLQVDVIVTVAGTVEI